MNYILSILLAGVLLWLCTAFTSAEAPRIDARIVKPRPPALQVNCEDRQIVCRARVRTEKVKEKVRL